MSTTSTSTLDNKLAILLYLGKNHPTGFTMHDLSKTLKIPYATFHREIQRLGTLVHLTPLGKAKVVTLNTDHPALRSYLAIASHEERSHFLKNEPILRQIAEESKGDVVLLFGSQAKGTAHEKSDIDILIIDKDTRHRSYATIDLLYQLKIRPIIVTKAEFLLMLRAPYENVGRQAVKGHIVFRNPETFWTLVLDGLQTTVHYVV